MKTSPETAALNELLTTLNNPDIVGVTPLEQRDEGKQPRDLSPDIAKLRAQQAKQPASQPPIAALPVALAPTRKLFFTGRLKAGKDYAAAALEATIFGFADPLYAIATHYFGVEVSSAVGKDTPGVRAFLQTVGQWGRGIVSEQYPLTVSRALFMDRVREDGGNGAFGYPEVDWSTFGHNGAIWLDACIARANAFLATDPDPLSRIAITNCRFNNEFKKLTEEGFQHWHVMVSPATWAKRLTASKLTMESPAVKDLSEQLAANLDSNVIRQLSTAKNGAKLRCLWNDDVAPLPSTRLHSLTTFLQSVKGA